MTEPTKAFATADLCDEFEPSLRVAQPIFRDYGGQVSFCGKIATVKVFEDNVLVRKMLDGEGLGRVLVVDGGGSLRCALVGDLLAQLAADNAWAGIIVNGCIRDSAQIARINIGVKALSTCPLKSIKRGEGTTAVSVEFAGVTFKPEAYVYADADGIVVADRDLLG